MFWQWFYFGYCGGIKMVDIEGRYVLALDFGGTKLACAIVDIEEGGIISYQYMLNKSKNAESNLNEMLVMSDSLVQQFNKPLDSIGVSFGGGVGKDGMIRSDHVVGWELINLSERLNKHYANIPIYLANDCNAAVLGEWYYGAGKHLKDCIYVQLSTGIGCGIIIEGRLYTGNGLAGEFGHICVEESDGYPCVCGNTGCLESFVSGWGLQKQVEYIWDTLPQDSILRKLSKNSPSKVSAGLIFDAARKGDPVSLEIVNRSIKKLGLGVSHLINLFDPAIIVFGGGIASDFPFFSHTMKQAVNDHILTSRKDLCQFIQSPLNGKAPLFGASILHIVDITE
jgi:glucokinase